MDPPRDAYCRNSLGNDRNPHICIPLGPQGGSFKAFLRAKIVLKKRYSLRIYLGIPFLVQGFLGSCTKNRYSLEFSLGIPVLVQAFLGNSTKRKLSCAPSFVPEEGALKGYERDPRVPRTISLLRSLGNAENHNNREKGIRRETASSFVFF